MVRPPPAWWIGTFFGAGLAPKMPGTVGTLAAVPLYFLLNFLGNPVYLISLALVCGGGVWAATACEELLGREDPPEVVIDEVAGYLLTMLFAPGAQWPWVVVGFLLFRLFDIWKPWPVGWLDAKLPAGWGIMADDLAAGLYAGAGLLIVQRLGWI